MASPGTSPTKSFVAGFGTATLGSLAVMASPVAAQDPVFDPYAIDDRERPSLPLAPDDLAEPLSIEQMQEQARREAERQPTGRTAEAGVGEVGQRLDRTDAPATNPIARIDNRIESRIRTRLRTRIDRYSNDARDTTSAFEEADARARNTAPR